MKKELYIMGLLIFGALLAEGLAIISNENIANSSDLQIRTKRVINHSPGGSQPAHITMSRHIVQVLVADTFECAGSILQANIIVTVRNCLYGSDDQYTVLSGSLIKNRGTRHRVMITTKHPRFNLALMKIAPAIRLSPRGSNKIALFTGPIPTAAFLMGWGCTNISPAGERIYPENLMAALLPIITHEQCVHAIQNSHINLLSSDVLCTLDAHGERSACPGDEGGSLVYGNRLLGIYSSNNGGVNLGVHPDLYVNLNHADIIRWININSHLLESIH